MIKKQFFFFLLLFAVFRAEPEVLKVLEIDGLKKTRVSTVKDIIGYDLGDSICGDKEEEIRQQLIKSGLFINETMEVDLTTRGDEAYLRIFLSDRVTLLPIPVFSVSQGDFSGGLFVMDRNFLGAGHQLFTGAMVSEESQIFMLGYANPSLSGSSFSLGGSLNGFSDDEVFTDAEGNIIIYQYQYQTLGGGISAGWGRDPFKVDLRLRLYALDTSLQEKSALSFQPEVTVGYDSLFYDIYFNRGIKTSFTYGVKTFTSGFDLTRAGEFQFSFQHLLFPRLQLQLNSDAAISRGDALQSLALQYGACGSILPDTVKADRFFQSNMKLQYALLDFEWGYLALPLSYQAGVLDGISGNHVFFQGPSGGLALYLKKVAIPAMAVQYAANLETGKGLFTFSIGMGL